MNIKMTLLVLALIICQLAFGQIEIFPATLDCPGESINYSTSPVSTNNQGCTYTWTVTNGLFSNGQTTISGTGGAGLDVSVTWNNVTATSNTEAPKGKLELDVSGCSLPAAEKIKDTESGIVILTLKGVTPPSISGSSTLAANVLSPKTYSIEKVKFPNTGVTSGWTSSVYADSYQWVIPAGWKIGGVTSNGSTPITNQSHSVASHQTPIPRGQ